MASDIAEDPDTLRIHHDMREQHINLAGIKAMIAAARGIEPDLQPMDEPFAGVWCTASAALAAAPFRKDAERYRWLRDAPRADVRIVGCGARKGDALDATVDELRGAA